MMKRTLAILTALLLLITMLPTLALADGETVISEIRLTGYVEPKADETAGNYPFAAIKSETPHVSVDPASLRWTWNGSEISMTDDQKFETGKAYYLDIDVKCDEGYTFAEDVKYYLNGSADLFDAEYTVVMDKSSIALVTKDFTVTAAEKPVSPTDVKPTEPAKPTSPTDVKPTSPTDVKPTSPTDVKPTSPTDVKPTEPTKPTEPVKPSEPSYKKGIVRLGGSDRFATANAISAEGWDNAKTVIIANAYNYADALAGAPLAYSLDAPILLASGDLITPALEAELKRLNPDNVIILGGEKAVSYSLQYSIQVHGYGTERIAGKDRYETAVRIAETLVRNNGKPSEVFVASGVNYPDALSASSAAAVKHAPILYSPKNGALDDQTMAFVKDTGASAAYILGGEAAIGNTAQTKLSGAGIASVKRLGGDDRYDTSMIIADTFRSLFSGRAVSLATGKNFPDALAGSVLAAKLKMPVLLTDNTNITDDTKYYIANAKPEGLYIFGSFSVISESIAHAYYDYAGNSTISKAQAQAYLAEINSLEGKYGKSTLYNVPNSNAAYLLGLCYTRLLDLDGDNIDELICAWGTRTKSDNYDEYNYTCRICTYRDGFGINKVYEGKLSNCGQDYCPAFTSVCDNGVYYFYTMDPSGEYKYYAMPEGIMEPIFTVEYDEYENVDNKVNGVKVTLKEAEKRHNDFLQGKAGDETDFFSFDLPNNKDHIAAVQEMTSGCIAKITGAAK